MTQLLDLLSGLHGSFTGPPILPAGLVEVGDKSITLEGRRLKEGQQLFESLSGLLI